VLVLLCNQDRYRDGVATPSLQSIDGLPSGTCTTRLVDFIPADRRTLTLVPCFLYEAVFHTIAKELIQEHCMPALLSFDILNKTIDVCLASCGLDLTYRSMFLMVQQRGQMVVDRERTRLKN